MNPPTRCRAGGFTLVEAIVVMVIIGILGAIVAVFIRAPILGYRDTVARAELTDQADLALRRMARDIRLALPNSVRVGANGAMLELLLTRSGGRYLAAEDGDTGLPVLDFENTATLQFTVLVPPQSFRDVRATSNPALNDYVVVYNLGEGFEPANAYNAAGAQRNIARIRSVVFHDESINGTSYPTATVTLVDNPFASQDTPMRSPTSRFQVVSGPVMYFCQAHGDGTMDLWRASGYAISATLAIPATGQRALVASRLTRCDNLFDYGTAASQLSGLATLDLELSGRDRAAGTIRLVHQVHVDNTP